MNDPRVPGAARSRDRQGDGLAAGVKAPERARADGVPDAGAPEVHPDRRVDRSGELGRALVDWDGRLIGIDTAILGPNGGTWGSGSRCR